MKTKNLEWLVYNALHGYISGDNSNDLQVMIKAEQEFNALLARVARLEETLKDAERVLEWAEPQPRPVLIRVRRALEEK